MFTGTLIVLIDWHIFQLRVLGVPHNDEVVLLSQQTVALLTVPM